MLIDCTVRISLRFLYRYRTGTVLYQTLPKPHNDIFPVLLKASSKIDRCFVGAVSIVRRTQVLTLEKT